MGNRPPDMHRFRERTAHLRNERRWSQAEVARRLTEMGIDNMHPTTVAKIEAGDREIKLDEAAAMADLYGLPLDSLLGRRPRGARDLHHVLGALLDAVYASQTQLHRTSKTLRDRLEDIPASYKGYDTLALLGRDVSGQLDGTQKALDRLKDRLDDELVAVAESRALKRLKQMSAREREQLAKSIPPAEIRGRHEA